MYMKENLFIKSSAPGRIILFGEHQDYFHLPVISAGVNLRISIQGEAHTKPNIFLDLKNMRRTYSIPLQFPIPYRFRRAYLQSAINVIHRKGYTFTGFNASLTSNIPQNAGLSSSSALTVAWTAFLARIVGKRLKPYEVAEWAFEAEVLEFNEPGGKQDHYATALGNINYLEFPNNEEPKFTPLNLKNLEDIAFVIGYSQVKKRTLRTVYRIKQRSINSMSNLGISLDSLKDIDIRDIPNHSYNQTLRAILKIRDLTIEGKELFQSRINGKTLGTYLTKQHNILKNELKLSVPRIESMIQGAMENGAYGCKITGTGEGGCILAICHPDDVDNVVKGIANGTGKPYHVSLDTGVKVNVFGSKNSYIENQAQ